MAWHCISWRQTFVELEWVVPGTALIKSYRHKLAKFDSFHKILLSSDEVTRKRCFGESRFKTCWDRQQNLWCFYWRIKVTVKSPFCVQPVDVTQLLHAPAELMLSTNSYVILLWILQSEEIVICPGLCGCKRHSFSLMWKTRIFWLCTKGFMLAHLRVCFVIVWAPCFTCRMENISLQDPHCLTAVHKNPAWKQIIPNYFFKRFAEKCSLYCLFCLFVVNPF